MQCLQRYDDKENDNWRESLVHPNETGILKTTSKETDHWRKLTEELTRGDWHFKVSHFHEVTHSVQQKIPVSTPHDTGAGCHIYAYAFQG